MRQVLRWLVSAGAATAVGVSLLAQGPAAVAGTAAAARDAGQAGARQARAVTAIARPAVPAWTPVTRTLKPGMSGADVRKVQRRLRALKYYPGKVDGQFGPNTLEAVWAFKEVQGLRTRRNPDDIGPAMERRLASPLAPRPLTRHTPNNRIDVNLRHQYLVLYRHGKVRLVSHISSGGGYYYPCPPPGSGTCGPAITPTGNYHALSFLPGQVKVPLGEMFNPVFFIGRQYAIHGDSYVPRQPVSHGCVRIPDNIANFFHTLFRIPGTRIYIRRGR